MRRHVNHFLLSIYFSLKAVSLAGKCRLLVYVLLNAVNRKTILARAVRFWDKVIFGTGLKVDNVSYICIDSDCLRVFTSLNHTTLLPYLLESMRNGKVLIDVGAHIGRFSLPVAKKYDKAL